MPRGATPETKISPVPGTRHRGGEFSGYPRWVRQAQVIERGDSALRSAAA